MSTSSLQSTVFLLGMQSETLTNELTDNSMDLRLEQRYSSNDISGIRAEYAPEEERIRDEIASLDKIEQKDEYEDLKAELNDLKEEKEDKIEKVENELNDYETEIQSENETLEVQLEDVNAQKESFEEMLKQNVEEESSYFN